MIDDAIRGLDATLNFVETLASDAHVDDQRALRASATRLHLALRALRALTPAEREYVAFVVDAGDAQTALERS